MVDHFLGYLREITGEQEKNLRSKINKTGDISDQQILLNRRNIDSAMFTKQEKYLLSKVYRTGKIFAH